MFVVFILLFQAHAAPCCGGSLSAPALILGDERQTLTQSFSQSFIRDDVDPDGGWHNNTNKEVIETLRLDYARVIGDRWQAGLNVSLQNKSRDLYGENSSATGLADSSVMLGYEILPDWEYNPIKPRGHLFTQIIIPTGNGINESQQQGLDVRGRGFWGIGLGTALTKKWSRTDVLAIIEGHKSFNKSVNDSSLGERVTLKPGYGTSVMFGAGYSYQAWRFGSELSFRYEDAVKVSGAQNSDGTLQRDSTVTLLLGYLFNDNWTSRISYSDQRLFGSPLNTSLGQLWALSIQRRWAR